MLPHLNCNVISCFVPQGFNQIMFRKHGDTKSDWSWALFLFRERCEWYLGFRCISRLLVPVLILGLSGMRTQPTICLKCVSSRPFLHSSELPHPPQNLMASLSPSHSHAVVLSWVRPFDGNSPVLHYIVELSENSE